MASASNANRLLAGYPWRWIAISLLFVAGVESVMLVPYVGFVLKAAISGIMIAQILVLYAAGDAGLPPRAVELWRGFLLPLSSQVALALTAFLPLAAGIVFLALVGKGDEAVAGFFGRVLSAPRLDPALFFVFKAVQSVAGVPVTVVSAGGPVPQLRGARPPLRRCPITPTGHASASAFRPVTGWELRSYGLWPSTELA